ncbi:hypothetical protein [Teredinibacter sp. KSP-S5-2]|uniref:hypothetical protein n=1 Tax=Teredinibacter sp. KSP-S5-2 TaxID=3034506 RepID=UPI0029352250|nr:hypothetical protein [Teredinibacter sp. KSP-S5-2]WNO11612.1 hypothetical protein P5V12_10560 [Teredinibacter sp. KSP-S5-2]
MNPKEAAAKYSLNQLSSKDIYRIADQWLVDGIFTDSINEISMEREPIFSVVGVLFENALEELGHCIPSRVEAAKYLIKVTLTRMVEEEIDLMEGANYIYWELHHSVTDVLPDIEHVGSNLGLGAIFCWLREIWDCRDGSMILYYVDLPREKAEAKFLEHLREESIKWLEKNA